MDDYDPLAYGGFIAPDYDELVEGVEDTEGAVACLVELAGEGPVLELGVGTGRLALPLAARGLRVHGVDTSPAMVARLRDKPGGTEHELPVTMADFAEVRLEQRFSLVVLAFNTIFALPTQGAQVACFETAAHHLRPGGHFVVEAWVPDPCRFHKGGAVWPRAVGGDRVSIELGWLDPVSQIMRTTQVRFGQGEVDVHPFTHRYAWPTELDLMARLAGLDLVQRWEGWRHDKFTASSATHVSAYRALS